MRRTRRGGGVAERDRQRAVAGDSLVIWWARLLAVRVGAHDRHCDVGECRSGNNNLVKRFWRGRLGQRFKVLITVSFSQTIKEIAIPRREGGVSRHGKSRDFVDFSRADMGIVLHYARPSPPPPSGRSGAGLTRNA